jgi:hypothetical protein
MNLTKKMAATAALMAISISGTAFAVPAVWTDTVTFTPAAHVSMFESVVYDHTLDGFNVGSDTVYNYSLSFNIFDDRDGWNEWTKKEWVLISQTGDWFDEIFFSVSGAEFGGWNLDGRLQLNDTGSLTVGVTSLLGDFYLGGSTLTARGDKKSSVPEPTTLALFGAALLGFGLTRRKRVEG